MELKFQIQNKKEGGKKGKNKNTGAEEEEKSKQHVDSTNDAGWCGEFEGLGLSCVEQPGTRPTRKARGQGQLFENLTWLNASEAAEYLRLPSVGMLRVLVCKREIPFHKWGRRLRFKKIELDRTIEASRNGGMRYGDQ
jgi:excisionase family DNA binding protein